MIRIAFLLVVMFCTAACGTAIESKKSIAGMDFVTFLDSAESHAAADQVFPDPNLKFPLRGKDFHIASMESQAKLLTGYAFASDPCVSRDLIAPRLSKLNYVQLPPGLPNSHEDVNGRDTYRLGALDGTRSINVEFWLSGNYRCLKHMFIDFPE